MPPHVLALSLLASLLAACERRPSEPARADTGPTRVAPTTPRPGDRRPPEPERQQAGRPTTADPPDYSHLPPALRPSERVPRGAGIETLARDQRWPFWVEVDQRHVYWNTGDGHLRRAPKEGGQVEELLGESSTTFVLDAEQLYFTSTKHLGRLPKSGGQATHLVSGRDPVGLVLDGDRLYYTRFKSRAIESVKTDGTAREVAHVFRRQPADHAVAGGYLYCATYGGGTVVRVPLRGGAPKVLAAGQPKPVGLSLDSSHVYFALEGDGTIRRCPLRGGRIETVVTGQHNHDILVGDDRALYWASWDPGQDGHALRRLDKPSGKVSTLATGLSGPSGLALDESHVYLANKGAWTVLRLPR